MEKGTDLTELYSSRKDFTVIGLTGRNGSGYTRVAQLISKQFEANNYPDPNTFDLHLNSFKKYKIIHKYGKENLIPYTHLRYKDFITLYLLKYDFNELEVFLKSSEVETFFNSYKIKVDSNLIEEINQLKNIESKYLEFQRIFNDLGLESGIKEITNANSFCDFFLTSDFTDFSNEFHKSFQVNSFAKHNLIIELLTNNIRKSGSPFSNALTDTMSVFSIANLINSIIKAIGKYNGNKPTKIVIDSFRNPFEIMFFKQRFSAFYLIAVNRDDKTREKVLERTFGSEYPVISELLKDEYAGGKGTGFFRQYVRECIEKADIHITFRSTDETKRLNKHRNDGTSAYYSWEMQVLKFLTLIEHPGLVTPSPEERCMQLAYTAKYNSGCISRQVGAAITDENYSLKAIGWNNTPEGQTPCSMRNAEVLLNSSDEKIKNELRIEKNNENKSEEDKQILDPELLDFTPYEKTNKDFKKVLEENYTAQIDKNKELLKGRNVCFCFKTLQNSCSEGKNQVHTRSLHAEESAFLQIAKYGGTSIMNGKLFTTASPCELCAKKAYQLGIKVIYYVDPYPGISEEQILSTGNNRPKIRLFNGAIGNAYHWLYEPFMSYKDELSLLLGLNIKDKVKQLEEESKNKDAKLIALEKENKILKQTLEKEIIQK